MATISKLVVSLEANSAKLYDTLSKSRKRFKKWAKNVGGYIKSIGKAFLIPIAAVGGFVVALNKSAAAIDDITKAAGKLGFPIEDYQRFAHIASISNVSMEQFGKGMQRMLKTVGDARDGLSTATKAFDALGLSWDVLAQQTPTEQLNQIGEALNKLPTQADKVKVAMDIFGRSGADFLNVFKGDVAAVGKEFDSLGITITAQQAAAVAAFQDSKTVLGALVGGIADNVTATLAPALTMLVDKTKDWIKSFGGGKKVAAVVAKTVIKTISAMIKGFAKVISFLDEIDLKMITIQQRWLELNYPIDLQFDTSNATKEMKALTIRGLQLEAKLSNKSEFVANVEKLAKDIEATVNVSLDEGEGGATADDNVNALASATDTATTAAKSFADVLKEVSGSSVWNDIFKQEKVTARSAQFDDVAKRLREGIEKGSAFTTSHLSQLTQIVQTAKNNQQVFTDQGTFGQVDIKGMTDVLLGLTQLLDAKSAGNPLAVAAEKIAAGNSETGAKFNQLINKLNSTPPMANVELSFLTDTGRIAGKIFAEPAFISQLKTFHDRQQQDGTRADTA